jgi:hypothetical protein
MVRGPYNANKHSSYVELVLVVDNKVYKALDQNSSKVSDYAKSIANIINAVSFLTFPKYYQSLKGQISSSFMFL